MGPFLLDALGAAMLGEAMVAAFQILLLGLVIIGLLVAFWKGYKQQQASQAAKRAQWTAEEARAGLARKKSRQRVWVAAVIVGAFALLASHSW
jgi:predicted lipid-binding transport protein (Tim44 family)